MPQDLSLIPIDRAPFTYKTVQAIAGTEFVPKGLRHNVPAIVAAIMTGRELGLGPMESLRSIDVIDGRPSPSAEWMVGRVFEAGHIIVATEQTAERCTVRGSRFIGPDGATYDMEFTFTIEMAKRAGLTSKTNWKHYPEAMLYWRAVAQLVRQFFPDVIRGIRHLPEELGEGEWLPPGYEKDMVTPDGPSLEEAQDDDMEVIEAELVEIVEPTPEAVELLLSAAVNHWPPEPTGSADENAINEVSSFDRTELRAEVKAVVNNFGDWIDSTMPEIERHVRFIFRGMECLDIWLGANTLRDDLVGFEGVQHLSEFKKKELQTFARNTCTKAIVALVKEMA